MPDRTDSDISVEGSAGANIAGRDQHGVPVQDFIAELRRKDDRIDRLIAEKDALRDRVSDLEKQNLEQQLAQLREQKEGVEAKLADPETAYREHKARETQIEQLLQDQATQMAIGENRIQSALAAFNDLIYQEIDALLEESEQKGIMLAANAAYGRGLVAEDAVLWHDAYTHYKRAAGLSDDLDHLKAYARLCWRLAKGDEAVRVQEDLTARVKGAEGAESAAYAEQLNNLSILLQAQGRYPKAEGLCREALEIDRKTIGEAQPHYAIHLNNLAVVVWAQSRYPEAEGFFRKALEITHDALGEANPAYATRLNNLAGVVRAQGRLAEAEGLCREALEITRKTIGEAHPDYAIRLINLGTLLSETGHVAEGCGMLEQALAILGAVLPPDHPHIAEAQSRLAALTDP